MLKIIHSIPGINSPVRKMAINMAEVSLVSVEDISDLKEGRFANVNYVVIICFRDFRAVIGGFNKIDEAELFFNQLIDPTVIVIDTAEITKASNGYNLI